MSEILCTVKDGIATITMNRPEKRNALNTALIDGFRSMFQQLETNTDVRVVIIRGEGKAFCSGIDLRELSSRQQAEADPETGVVQIFQQIERSRHPTIAMVQGDALAGGCELALHCDLRVVCGRRTFRYAAGALGIGRSLPSWSKTGGNRRPSFYQTDLAHRATY